MCRCSARCGKGFIFINLINTDPLRSFQELARRRGVSVRWPTPRCIDSGWNFSATGRLRRQFRRELPRSVPACLVVRATAEAKEALDKPNPFTDALAYQLKGPHRMFSFAGEPSRQTPYSKPIECVMKASAAGPWKSAPYRGPCLRHQPHAERRTTASTRSSSFPTLR